MAFTLFCTTCGDYPVQCCIIYHSSWVMVTGHCKQLWYKSKDIIYNVAIFLTEVSNPTPTHKKKQKQQDKTKKEIKGE
jgi:hypothetical protein